MRGKKTSIAETTADLVLVSARYDREDGHLLFARGYARRGQVWTDIKLFDRDRLLEALRQGQNVVTGKPASLEGDFEVIAPVELSEDGRLYTFEASDRDDLKVPIL